MSMNIIRPIALLFCNFTYLEYDKAFEYIHCFDQLLIDVQFIVKIWIVISKSSMDLGLLWQVFYLV